MASRGPDQVPNPRARLGSDPVLGKGALDDLLNCLNPESREAAGQIYQHLRESLVRYFERRRCSVADVLADQTLDRVAAKAMEKSISISGKNPGGYCLRVARFIYLEYLRRETPKPGEAGILSPVPAPDPDVELQHQCLDGCLEQLSDMDRIFQTARTP